MNNQGEQFGRPTNDKKQEIYVRDEENTFLWRP